MTFSRISILGVGLLGGSIGLAVKSRVKGCHVVGYGHRKSTLDAALFGSGSPAAAISMSAAAGHTANT